MATFSFWKAVAAHPQIWSYAYLWARHDWINRPAYVPVISCSLGGEGMKGIFQPYINIISFFYENVKKNLLSHSEEYLVEVGEHCPPRLVHLYY